MLICILPPSRAVENRNLCAMIFRGIWSHRITSEHRLVYRIKDGALEIAQRRFHY